MDKPIFTKIVEMNGEACFIIPDEIAKNLGWKAGTKVVFEVIDSNSFKISKWKETGAR